MGRVSRRSSWTVPSPLHFECFTVIVSGGVGGLLQCSWCNQKRMLKCLDFLNIRGLTWGHVVAWLRPCALSWKVLGLFMDDAIGIFH